MIRPLVPLAALFLALPAIAAESDISLEFRGEVILDQGLTVGGHRFGGISGLSHDPDDGVYYAIGDDLADARFHTLRIDISDGRLDEGDVEVLSSTLMQDVDGRPFAEGSVDPEGIVAMPDGTLLIAAETVGDRFPAFIRRYTREGEHLGQIPLDPRAMIRASPRTAAAAPPAASNR